MKDDTSTPMPEGASRNAFERDKPGTNARTDAEAAIEELRLAGGVFVNAVRATRMPMVLTAPNLPGNPIVFANDSFLKLSGYSMAEVLGQQPHFMNGSGTDPKDAARFAEMLRSEQDEILETIQYRKDGSRFIATVLISAFKDPEGKILHHFMSWLDVTRRVDAESEIADLKVVPAALRVSEAKYRGLFDSIDEGFCIIEVLFDDAENLVDYVFLEVNPAFERQTGLRNAVGKRMRELAPEHEQFWFDVFGEVALTGESRRFEQPAEALGYWYDVYAFRIGEPEDRHVAILFNDIQERKRAEELIRSSEERLRDVLDSMTEGFALFDPDFTILDVNEETLELDGRARDELVGRSHWEAFPESEHSSLGEMFKRVMSTREPGLLEHVYRWPDGKEMWIDARAYPTSDGGIACFWRDITDRKRTEDALRESEERLQAAFQSVPVGVAVIDMEGKVITANEEHRRFLPTGIVPSRDPERIHRWRSWDKDGKPIDPENWPSARALSGEQVVPGLDMLFTADDGREIWTWVAAVPTRGGGGQVTGAVSTITDVDTAKRNQGALQDSEERLRLIVNSAHDYAIFTTDPDNRIDNWLPGAENVFGWSKEEAEGQPVDITFTPEDRDRGEPRKEIETARAEGTAPDVRWHQRKDGRRVFIDGQMIALRDASGTIDGFLKIGQDITEKHRTSEMQSTLLAELQHRVRNTLAVVRSIARRTAENSETVDEMLAHFQGRLDAFSRVQAALTRNPNATVDLASLIDDELVAHATREGEQVRIEGPPVQLDPKTAERMSLALHELTTNAVKHGALKTRRGAIAIRWQCAPTPNGEDLILVWEEACSGHSGNPDRRGFGMELLQRSLPYDLNAETKVDLRPSGLRFELRMALRRNR